MRVCACLLVFLGICCSVWAQQSPQQLDAEGEENLTPEKLREVWLTRLIDGVLTVGEFILSSYRSRHHQATATTTPPPEPSTDVTDHYAMILPETLTTEAAGHIPTMAFLSTTSPESTTTMIELPTTTFESTTIMAAELPTTTQESIMAVELPTTTYESTTIMAAELPTTTEPTIFTAVELSTTITSAELSTTFEPTTTSELTSTTEETTTTTDEPTTRSELSSTSELTTEFESTTTSEPTESAPISTTAELATTTLPATTEVASTTEEPARTTVKSSIPKFQFSLHDYYERKLNESIGEQQEQERSKDSTSNETDSISPTSLNFSVEAMWSYLPALVVLVAIAILVVVGIVQYYKSRYDAVDLSKRVFDDDDDEVYDGSFEAII